MFEETERQLTTTVMTMAAAAKGTRWEQFLSGCRAFLDVSTEPRMRQILLVDGRVVLGVEEWRRIMIAQGLGMTRAALAGLMAQGIIIEQPAEPLALLVMALLDEAAIIAAANADPAAARAEMGAVVERMLDGLRRV